MNILIISELSLNEKNASTHLVKDIVYGILERKHNIDIIERGSNKVEVDIDWLNQLPINRIIIEKSQKNKSNFIKRYISELLYGIKVKKKIRSLEKIDCVLCLSCSTPYIYLIGNFFKKRKIPFIYNPQDLFPDNLLCITKFTKDNILYKMLHFLQKYAYQKTSHIITISDDMKQTIMSSYGIDSEKISIIHNWGNYNQVQLIRNNDNYFYNKYGFSEDYFNVVYAGNIGKMQNVEVILLIAENLKYENVKFYIVGNGANYLAFRYETEKRKLENVIFLPSQSSDNAIFVYSAADLNIIPLVDGGIYTALPSKTANCIASGKQLLACVNKKSIFGKMMIQYGFKVAEVNNIDEISNIILDLKYNKTNNYDSKGALKQFSIDNSKEYINIIEKIMEELK